MAIASAGNIKNCDVLVKDTYKKTISSEIRKNKFMHWDAIGFARVKCNER